MKVLVIGGAGYIGRHIVVDLIKKNHNVTVFDNLSTGFINDFCKKVNFVFGDILNTNDLEKLFSKKYDIVMHFAGLKAAGESMINPQKFSKNNLIGTVNLLEMMLKKGIVNIIFSSSASVYGYPEYLPIDENHSTNPNNFYGYTKLCIENILNWYSRLGKIKFVSLRYFNAAGYDTEGRVLCMENNPQNLLPIVMEVCSGQRSDFTVYGDDYKTHDGTCVRDYIHVNDLSDAHIKSMDYLFNEEKNLTLNLATGIGYSVLEVIKMAKQITSRKILYNIGKRRAGDADILISKSLKAKEIINWVPKKSSLEVIIDSMWKLYKN